MRQGRPLRSWLSLFTVLAGKSSGHSGARLTMLHRKRCREPRRVQPGSDFLYPKCLNTCLLSPRWVGTEGTGDARRRMLGTFKSVRLECKISWPVLYSWKLVRNANSWDPPPPTGSGLGGRPGIWISVISRVI